MLIHFGITMAIRKKTVLPNPGIPKTVINIKTVCHDNGCKEETFLFYTGLTSKRPWYFDLRTTIKMFCHHNGLKILASQRLKKETFPCYTGLTSKRLWYFDLKELQWKLFAITMDLKKVSSWNKRLKFNVQLWPPWGPPALKRGIFWFCGLHGFWCMPCILACGSNSYFSIYNVCHKVLFNRVRAYHVHVDLKQYYCCMSLWTS